jgi:thiol:disulfide interchange protein
LVVPAVNWAITQPATLTFLAFTFIGLGMAAPYLMVGAFPQMINLLPKPGAWMETFKQLMGFLLAGTVIWLFTSLEQKWVIPTMTMLLGVGLACWLVGRIPVVATLLGKFAGWAGAVVVIVLFALLGFIVLAEKQEWEPFTRVALDNHLEQGRTVLIDFTANW